MGLPEDKHEFPIAVMQEVIRELSLKPARGRHRVAIIDDADQFNDESANSFLKTLEEPPPASLLILIGTSPDRQLPTILSRCQVIRFSPLPSEAIAERLVKEGIVEKPAEAAQLAKLSGGSFADAAALADPPVGKFRHEFLERLTKPGVDTVALAKRLVEFVEEAGKESAPKRQRAALALKFLIELIRSAIVIQQGRPPPSSEGFEAQPAGQLAGRVPGDVLMGLLDRCLDADYQVERRLQLVLVLEALIDALGAGLESQPAR